MKALIIGLLLLSFMSCQIVWEVTDEVYYSQIQKGPILEFDIEGLDNTFDMADYMNSMIEFKLQENKIRSAEYTINHAEGDCASFAVVFINIWYQITGEKCDLIVVDDGTRSVVKGGFTNHAVVELPDGRQINAQFGDRVDYTIGYRYTFDELFY